MHTTPVRVKDAALYPYLIDDSTELFDHLKRPLVLLCPGGGYEFTSDREAELVALRFLSAGMHAAVLRYSVDPAGFPKNLLELAESVRYIREHADEFCIDPRQIYVCGFSAGGHLAASLAVMWHEPWLKKMLSCQSEDIRPDGLILAYPVISADEKIMHEGSFRNLLHEEFSAKKDQLSLEKLVTDKMPETFLWHSWFDDTVPVENSLVFVEALRKNRITTEFHMYASGNHGIGTADRLTQDKTGRGFDHNCAAWLPCAIDWIRYRQRS